MTTLGLEYLKHQENKRANLAKEAELNRHNIRTEGTDRANVDVKYAMLDETARANQAKEAETHRSNIEQEKLKGLQTLNSISSAAAAQEYADSYDATIPQAIALGFSSALKDLGSLVSGALR